MDGQGSNPGVSVILRTRTEEHLGPPSFLYNGNQVLPGGKPARTWRLSPNPSRAEVKEIVDI